MSQVRAPSIATECCSWQGLSRSCAEASSGSIDVVVLVGPIVHTEEKEGEISVRGITKKIIPPHHTWNITPAMPEPIKKTFRVRLHISADYVDVM